MRKWTVKNEHIDALIVDLYGSTAFDELVDECVECDKKHIKLLVETTEYKLRLDLNIDDLEKQEEEIEYNFLWWNSSDVTITEDNGNSFFNQDLVFYFPNTRKIKIYRFTSLDQWFKFKEEINDIFYFIRADVLVAASITECFKEEDNAE